MMLRFQQSKYILGTTCRITLVCDDQAHASEIFSSLWKEIDEFDQRFSRFKTTSELSRFNKAAGRFVKTSSAFHDFLVASRTLSLRSDGLFNPLVLPGLQLAGYVGSWPTPDIYKETLDFRSRDPVVSMSELDIKWDSAYMPATAALDSGGIGKGYLADQLAKYLNALGVHNYWLSLGGDIIARGRDVDYKPWAIGLGSAADPTEVLAEVSNEGGRQLAVATSGTASRRGERQGVSWHHLIDPRTAKPAKTDIVSASVVGLDCVTADIYAKCLVILGTAHMNEFIKEHLIEAAYVQTVKGKKFKLGIKNKVSSR